jgi:hypothetical protein
LNIDKSEPLPCILKGVFKCYAHNPNARGAQNYSFCQGFGPNPMHDVNLEVLQMCPSQRNALLYKLLALDPCGSNFIKFDVTDINPHLPYHVAFQIHVEYTKVTIKCIVIDEGSLTFVMSLACWKAIGSPPLSQSIGEERTSFISIPCSLYLISLTLKRCKTGRALIEGSMNLFT